MSTLERKKRLTPTDDAKLHISANVDKKGLEKRYVNDYIGI